MLWYFGNTAWNVPAMKAVKGTDFSTKNDGKRLSDLRFLIKMIDQEATEIEIYKDNPSTAEA
eukprot:696938-Hanusia_phi.AAC.1